VWWSWGALCGVGWSWCSIVNGKYHSSGSRTLEVDSFKKKKKYPAGAGILLEKKSLSPPHPSPLPTGERAG